MIKKSEGTKQELVEVRSRRSIQPRRSFLKTVAAGSAGIIGWTTSGRSFGPSGSVSLRVDSHPNILLAISDDQSWLHAGAYGCRAVRTPAFDSVAEDGVLFQNFFCAAPQCSPNRAAILTGRNIGQLEEAGTHASNFPRKFRVYPDLLEQSGYEVGFTGKGWGPGNWEFSCRPRNPAGPEYSRFQVETRPTNAVGGVDYAKNFRDFLDRKDPSRPFCFWHGSSEPHRVYERGSGLKAGKRLEDVEVPPFLPDTAEVRSDLLDYLFEIEWFDQHLGQMLDLLKTRGELENTLVVVTSDNGMPFPGAKANLYEYGTHVPFAVSWPARVKRGRRVDELVSSIDLAPTFLEAAGVEIPDQVSGKSLLGILTSTGQSRSDPQHNLIVTGRERHSHARPHNAGYPARAIRTSDFLYIRNYKPDRWPVGDPAGSGEPSGFHDVDESPTKTLILENRDAPEFHSSYRHAFEKRPAEELYDIPKDPGCLQNLAGQVPYASVQEDLAERLEQILRRQDDPRVFGSEIFESYPRYSRMRSFEGFKEQGEYNFSFPSARD